MHSARSQYDAAIIGLGTMGSFAAAELARRGLRVAGFDRFTPPHDRGSHSGWTRIYRTAYAEGSGYVPLTQRAGDLWDRASEEAGMELLHRTGMLYMGPADGAFLRGVTESATAHRLQYETLTAAEIRLRYPAFPVPDEFAGTIDLRAGWLDVEASIHASLAAAQAAGADCRFAQPVQGWEASGDEVRVFLEKETVTAARLIVTAGSWAGTLLHELNLPLVVRRKTIAWIDPLAPELFAPGRIPIFAFPENFLYGFPSLPGKGVKVAEHQGGAELAGPEEPIRPPDAEDLNPICATLSKYAPGLAGSYPGGAARIAHAQTCLYTMTPDEDFIVDRHPQFENVVFAAGFSGHGFKFAPLVAVALADLAIEGKTSLPIDFLSVRRFFSPAVAGA